MRDRPAPGVAVPVVVVVVKVPRIYMIAEVSILRSQKRFIPEYSRCAIELQGLARSRRAPSLPLEQSDGAIGLVQDEYLIVRTGAEPKVRAGGRRLPLLLVLRLD
jgi:hypothetical protein